MLFSDVQQGNRKLVVVAALFSDCALATPCGLYNYTTDECCAVVEDRPAPNNNLQRQNAVYYPADTHKYFFTRHVIIAGTDNRYDGSARLTGTEKK